MDATLLAPWLSVLIPVYNAQRYLAECVESVLAQADDGVEILLLDDCSTDGSTALMQQLAQRWPGRLQLLRQPRNQGPSAARNRLLDAARGEYVWFIDADDTVRPGALAALQAVVRQARPDLVVFDFEMLRAQPRLKHRLRGERHRRTFAGPANQLLRDRAAFLTGLMLPGQWHPWSKLARRALWTPDLRFPVGTYFEDLATLPRLALRAHSLWYLPEPCVAYRQHTGSILATMTPDKAADLSAALRAFRHEFDADAPLHTDASLRFAVAHQCARDLHGALRHAALPEPSTAATRAVRLGFRDDFLACSPLSSQQLQQAYGRRGWWLRRARFRAAWRELER